jgi:hypothetical protein
VHPGCLLVLILIGLFLVVAYWQIILTVVVCIIGLLGVLMVWSNLATQAKIKAVTSSDIVFGILNKQYAIPLNITNEQLPTKNGKTIGTKVVNMVIPEVDNQGVKFNYQSEKLTNIKPLDGHSSSHQDCQTLKAISPMIKDILLKIRPQNDDLGVKIHELEDLRGLVETSGVYQNRADLFTRAIERLHDAIVSGGQLEWEYLNFIREALIEQRIAAYNPAYLDTIADTKIELQSKCQIISEQYEQIKLEVAAYDKLKAGVY